MPHSSAASNQSMPNACIVSKKHTGFPQVIYDADELLRGNDDSIADDVIQMFSSEVRIYEFLV